MTDTLYTLEQAAELLGVHVQTLKKRQQRGTLKGTRYGSPNRGMWLFTREQLDASNVATPPRGREKKLDYDQIMLLIDQGHTKTEIAVKFGVTQSAVSKLVARRAPKLKRRKPSHKS